MDPAPSAAIGAAAGDYAGEVQVGLRRAGLLRVGRRHLGVRYDVARAIQEIAGRVATRTYDAYRRGREYQE